MVDAQKIRDTGEFSDFEVSLKGKSFKLHKFPLYTKSDYFKVAATKNSSVKLDDFPGDEETFSMIADYCYDKPITITPKNLALVQISAEFLKMNGENNLISKCDKLLNSIFSDAKNTRKLTALIYVLIQSGSLPNSNDIEIYKRVYQVVLGLWQRVLTKYPTGISPRSIICVSNDDEHEEYFEDKLVTDHLIFVPLNTISNIIKDCVDSKGKKRILANLLAKYLGRILDIAESLEDQAKDDQNGKNEENSKTSKATNDKLKNKKDIMNKIKKDSKEKDEKQKSMDSLNDISEDRSASPTLVKAKPLHLKVLKQGASSIDPMEKDELEEFSANLTPNELTPIMIFNKVFEELPEDVNMHDVLSTYFIKDALKFVESKKTEEKCREKLLNIAAKMLGKFSPEDLRDISATTLGDIVDKIPKEEIQKPETLSKLEASEKNETETEPNAAGASETKEKTTLSPEMINSLDQYLNELADKKSVNVDEYIRLLKPSVPENVRLTHDGLVSTLMKIVNAENPLSDQQKTEILKIIDLERCSPNSLQSILELDLLPPRAVAEAAIKVAKATKPYSFEPYKSSVITYSPKHETLNTTVTELSESCPPSCLSYYPDDHLTCLSYSRCKSPSNLHQNRPDTCQYSRSSNLPSSVNFTDYYYGDKRRSYSPRSSNYGSKYGYY